MRRNPKKLLWEKRVRKKEGELSHLLEGKGGLKYDFMG